MAAAAAPAGRPRSTKLESFYHDKLAAAHLKANHRLSYADAFAAALAREYNAAVVTGDPEFRALGDKVRLAWLG
jgi:predicted nucleic acid-binding protein